MIEFELNYKTVLYLELILTLTEQLCCPQEHRGVHIMPAGVHHPRPLCSCAPTPLIPVVRNQQNEINPTKHLP